MSQIRLLGLSGSLRRASNSTAVLRGLRNAPEHRATLDIFLLHAIPLYNKDDDARHAPEPERNLRSVIDASDGVILISPEYNHGMSGVLKNALRLGPTGYGFEKQAGADDDGLACIHGGCTRTIADERDPLIDSGAPCFSTQNRYRRCA